MRKIIIIESLIFWPHIRLSTQSFKVMYDPHHYKAKHPTNSNYSHRTKAIDPGIILGLRVCAMDINRSIWSFGWHYIFLIQLISISIAIRVSSRNVTVVISVIIQAVVSFSWVYLKVLVTGHFLVAGFNREISVICWVNKI